MVFHKPYKHEIVSEKLHLLKFCSLYQNDDVPLCVGDAISLTDGATEAAADHTNSEGMI